MAWEAWKCYSDVTTAFNHMALNPYIELDTDSQYFRLYDKTSELDNVDTARMELFCHGNELMEKIPPTQGALMQHSKRAAYPAGIWCTSELSNQERPSPEGWGWSWDDKIRSWTPVWTTLPIASKACAELIKCGCKSKNVCGARCGCKANLMCTELCSCKCAK